MTQQKSCAHCNQPKPQQGGGLKNICGSRCWVCTGCKDKLSTKTYAPRNRPGVAFLKPPETE